MIFMTITAQILENTMTSCDWIILEIEASKIIITIPGLTHTVQDIRPKVTQRYIKKLYMRGKHLGLHSSVLCYGSHLVQDKKLCQTFYSGKKQCLS